MDYSVGEVARLAGITVRTLHHYDELGLVTAERSTNGHRTHDRAALERLQQALFFRALDFQLDNIGRIVTDPGFDRAHALERQRELMIGKLARTRETVAAIEAAIAADREGVSVEAEDMFGGFDPADYEDEVKERWGTTDSYREAGRRTKGYTKADRAELQSESGAILESLADPMRASTSAEADEAVELAEAHRLHIDHWFYPCSREMHLALGESYVADPRFTAFYDKIEPGLATYLRDAIAANAAGA
jgi:DNA-binding transcriptional MerR regulator